MSWLPGSGTCACANATEERWKKALCYEDVVHSDFSLLPLPPVQVQQTGGRQHSYIVSDAALRFCYLP